MITANSYKHVMHREGVPMASRNPLTFATAISCMATSELRSASFFSFCHFRSNPRLSPYTSLRLGSMAADFARFDCCDIGLKGDAESTLGLDGTIKVGLLSRSASISLVFNGDCL